MVKHQLKTLKSEVAMSREGYYAEYANRILKSLKEWPTTQEDMEKFIQLIVICVEKCFKAKKGQEFNASNAVWLTYSKAYKERYGLEPPTSPINYRHCKNLMTSLGSDKAIEVIEYYLKQNDSWYVKNCHSLSALIANQNYQALYTKLKTGLNVTDKTARSMEKATNSAKASMEYLTKKHGGEKNESF